MGNLSNLSNINLERECISSLLRFPDLCFDIEGLTQDEDFEITVHKAAFSLIRDARFKKESIDSTILASRLNSLGINRMEELPIFDYLDSLKYCSFANVETSKLGFQELSKLRILRGLVKQAHKTEKYVLDNANKDIDIIISEVDVLNNTVIQKYNNVKPPNIFESIKQVVEDRADNPPKNFLYGPFKTINEIYGTLLPPACLNLIGARSGVSKTALSMFYLLHVAEKYDLPILHCDFSEMTIEQLQFRAISAFTNGLVPYSALVRGTWRKNEEWSKLVRKVYPRVEKLRMFYFDVGNMSEREQLTLMRRMYNKEVKGKFGGDQDKEILLLNYDYLKPFDSNNLNSPEWKVMGKWIQDYKSLVNNEIPQLRGWFSLQVNRSGITNNKSSNQVDDSENAFTMSDRIMQQSTSCFIIRQKLQEEISLEGNRWGNLKMIPLKFREVLGDQWERHFNWIKAHDGKFKKNYINLNMKSFFFEDKSDCQAVENFLMNQVNLDNHNQPNNDIHL